MFLLFIFGFFQSWKKATKCFISLKAIIMILCTTLLIVLDCTFFKLVTNPLQKLKNGPLYSGHPKLSKFVRCFYMEI